MNKPPRKYIGIIILIVFLTAYFALQAAHLQFFQYDTDEGIILSEAKILAAGYPLYTKIWTNQPPLLPALLAAALQTFGYTIEVGRIVILCHTMLALIAVALLIRAIGGDWYGAVGGVIVLALVPSFFGQARAVGRALPSAAWAILALALAFRYRHTRRRRWLVCAGLSMAASLMIKLINAPTLLIIGLIVLFSQDRRDLRRIVIDGTILAATIGVPSLLIMLAFDFRALSDAVFLSYFEYRREIPVDWQKNLASAAEYLLYDNFAVCALALAGLLPHLRRRTIAGRNSHCAINNVMGITPCAIALWLWFGVNLLAVLNNSPFWTHHLLPLLINLAIFAGLGISKLKALLTDRALAANLRGFSYVLALTAILVTLGLQDLVEMARRDWEIANTQPDSDVMHAIELVREMTAPGDFVFTDFPMIPLRADRLIPPEICDTSAKRHAGGDLTHADLVRYTETYNPPVVVLWNGLFRFTPEYRAWLDCHYPIAHKWKFSQEIRMPRRDEIAIPHQYRALFGDAANPQIELIGYALEPAAPQPNAEFKVTLYWRAVADVDIDYTAFVHIYAPEGQLWTQHDAPPSEHYGTSKWQIACTVEDKRQWQLPPELPAAPLTLKVGLYRADTMQRIPAFDAAGNRFPDDSAVLITFP